MITDFMAKSVASGLETKPCPSCGQMCEHSMVSPLAHEVQWWDTDESGMTPVVMRARWKCSSCGKEHKAGAVSAMSDELLKLLEQESAHA